MALEEKRFCSYLYPVVLEVQFKGLTGKLPVAGTGATTLMGSRELVFTADGSIKAGVRLELSVAWPVLLDDHVKLQLVIVGRATAVDGNRVTFAISKYHFRTRGPRGAGLSRQWIPGLPMAATSRPLALSAHA